MVSPPDGSGSFLDQPYELTSSTPVPRVVIARVAGDLDYLVTPQLRARLFDRLDAGPTRFVLDLGGVRLLSAAAMEVLLGLDVLAAAQGCEVRIVAATRAVRRPLALTGLDQRLRLFDTVDAALAR